jgi:hypothetical protein
MREETRPWMDDGACWACSSSLLKPEEAEDVGDDVVVEVETDADCSQTRRERFDDYIVPYSPGQYTRHCFYKQRVGSVQCQTAQLSDRYATYLGRIRLPGYIALNFHGLHCVSKF